MSLFSRKKTTVKASPSPLKVPRKTTIKPLDYSPKIIIAWSEAIKGNRDISLWLKENGYPELVFASAAILLKDEARTWLMENGYAHLMAMINAAEGDESAQIWLKKNNFELLYHIALAIESNKESWTWMQKNASPDLIILTTTIKKIKDKIEENHNDIHSFRKDQ